MVNKVYTTHKVLIPAQLDFIEEVDDIPIEIEVDQDRLTQVLTNFLNNASKFTKEGYIKLGYCLSLIHISVRQLHFEEAAELAYFGAKILHPTCIQPAKYANIPVRLLNTMAPDAPGTLISNDTEKGKIKAVAAKENITAIKIKSSRMLLLSLIHI